MLFRRATKKPLGRMRYQSRGRLLGIGMLSTISCGCTLYYNSISEKDKRQVKVTIGGVRRFLRSAKIGATISMDYWWSLRRLEETNDNYLQIIGDIHRRSAERILNGCLNNGGLYIKLGQGLVNLDHVLPKEYTQTLKVLQDKCLVRKENEVIQLFEEDFGVPYTEMFSSFSEEPIAAASIAQVYKAKTKEGMEVAVKAQYIDLQDRFVGDMTTVKLMLKFAGWLFPKFDFEWLIHELHEPLERELDFLQEGKNAEKCAKDLAHLDFVYVPKVLWDKSSKRVLTTEFIDGIKINETEKCLDGQFSLADIDTKLFTVFAEQIFHTGFVHADPHPGNVLIRKGKDGKAQLVLLDHGLYENLSTQISSSLSNLWRGIALRNYVDMKKYSKELGIEGEDYRLFCIAITQKYIPPEQGTDDIMELLFRLQGPALAKSFRNLSKEEIKELRMEADRIQDKFLDIFKRLPGKMILVSRNLNAVRSISKIHGNPVDRHKIMAHCAAKRLFQPEGRIFLIPSIRNSIQRLIFEFYLWFDGIRRWILQYFVKLKSSPIQPGFL